MPDTTRPDAQHVAAIVLAAGAARRFGADKLLHPLTRDGSMQPLICHSLRPWLAAGERVAVVVRPDAGALRQQTAMALGEEIAARIDWVICTEAERGLGRSLACGVAAHADAAGWLIGLADMPGVPAAVIAQVRAALMAGAPLAAPCHHGVRGHPVGFSAKYRNELLALDGDRGARQLVERDAAALQRIESEDAGILLDIDTPADLKLLIT